jgi:hypothetical protein
MVIFHSYVSLPEGTTTGRQCPDVQHFHLLLMALHFFRPWSLRKNQDPAHSYRKKTVKSVLPLLHKEPWLIEVFLSIYSLIYVLIYVIYIYTYYTYIYNIYICPIISPLCHHYGWWARIIGKDHFLCLIVSSPGSLSKMAKLLARQIRSTKKLGHSCIPQLFQSWLCQFSHIYPSMARDVEQIIKLFFTHGARCFDLPSRPLSWGECGFNTF